MFYLTYERVKLIQAVLIISVGIMGLTSGLLFANIGKAFQKNCIMYANVTIQLREKPEKGSSVVVVASDTKWGTPEVCDLVAFEGILVFIISFIWLWFFLNMEFTSHGVFSLSNLDMPRRITPDYNRWSFYLHRSRNGQCDCAPQDSHSALFVIPPIFTNTVLCFLSIVRVAYATDGYQHFCFSLCKIQNGIPCDSATDGCRQLQNHNWVFLTTLTVQRKAFAFHDAMKAALVFSWLEPLLLATHVLLIVGHVYLEANPPQPAFSGVPCPSRTSNSTMVFRSCSVSDCVDTFPKRGGSSRSISTLNEEDSQNFENSPRSARFKLRKWAVVKTVTSLRSSRKTSDGASTSRSSKKGGKLLTMAAPAAESRKRTQSLSVESHTHIRRNSLQKSVAGPGNEVGESHLKSRKKPL